MAAILEGYRLPQRGHHGVVHWARVMENGLRIAETNGADVEVVALFALFHDSRRENEQIDDGHEQRGAEFARTLRGSLVHLDDRRFELFYEACRLHTDGLTDADPTIQACWDADRLDLGRVGITPHKRFLCTEEAHGQPDSGPSTRATAVLLPARFSPNGAPMPAGSRSAREANSISTTTPSCAPPANTLPGTAQTSSPTDKRRRNRD